MHNEFDEAPWSERQFREHACEWIENRVDRPKSGGSSQFLDLFHSLVENCIKESLRLGNNQFQFNDRLIRKSPVVG